MRMYTYMCTIGVNEDATAVLHIVLPLAAVARAI